jgi:hypothetical protein
MRYALQRLIREPFPLRSFTLRRFGRWFNHLSYPIKLEVGLVERPHYGHCVRQAALLARKLGYERITAIELGVAGGNGLLALEKHAAYVKDDTGVMVATYGFDSGKGMPAPVDYRDLPYLFQAGNFQMDIDRLNARLKSSKLVIGEIENTIRNFCESENPPPIGFISFDLDYYSSTIAAFRIFEAEFRYFLPRVACYFDDMVGDVDWAYNEFTGELLAIKEFNATHERMKIAPVRGLRFCRNWIPRIWHEQIFVAHLFDHPDYGRPISDLTQLPLAAA